MTAVVHGADIATLQPAAQLSDPWLRSAGRVEGERDPVCRVLLVVNRCSGTGHDDTNVRRLAATLRTVLSGAVTVDVDEVTDHLMARRDATEFLAGSRGPAAIIVAGGGGTLRAVVEAVFADGDRSFPAARVRTRLAALRMGSGNVVARHLGVEADPDHALRAIAAGIAQGATVPVNVMRCGVGQRDGTLEPRYAVTMCGLGQFGRTSGDLARWHRRLRGARVVAAGFLGLEQLNNIEYALSALGRAALSAARPGACERMRVSVGGRAREMHVLAGAAMNLPVGWLPEPGVALGDTSISLLLLPYRRRLVGPVETRRVDIGERIEVELLDRDSAEFFLDEDPDLFWGRLTLETAGCLDFVPGGPVAPPARRATR
jgi:hypothetical protein